MSKLGDEYQEIVGAVQKALDPDAKVDVGIWIVGPDGRRDMDVSVCGTKDGRPFRTLIECKDWQSPVGIAAIDALDSKRRDLAVNTAILFSNSGFTADALRKARRVGIGLAAAIAQGNERVRGLFAHDVIAKQVKLCQWHLYVFWNPDRDGPSEVAASDIWYNELPLINWIEQTSRALLQAYPEKGLIHAEYRWTSETPFRCSGAEFLLTGLALRLFVETTWARQTVPVDISLGYFDILTNRAWLPDNQRYYLGPFRNDRWEPFSPPEAEIVKEKANGASFKFDITLTSLYFCKNKGYGIPPLDDLIEDQAISFPDVV